MVAAQLARKLISSETSREHVQGLGYFQAVDWAGLTIARTRFDAAIVSSLEGLHGEAVWLRRGRLRNG